jgi:hypothetical protein
MKSSMHRILAALLTTGILLVSASAEEEKFNYDEAKVAAYTLPDPLVMRDGRPVTSAKMWQRERRPELVDIFESQLYGRRPPEPLGARYDVSETDWHGKATRKRVKVELVDKSGSYPAFTIHIFVPRAANGPVPAFVGMHLFDTKLDDPVPGKLLTDDVGHPLPGAKILEVILDRGYAIATLDAADFCPDNKETYLQGVLAHMYPERKGPPGAEQPGAIATWAWALSRALDYFQQDGQIDAARVTVVGHSRMGKTALWAGAEDPRFAIVISNNSGCGGAALSRRIFGETVARINRVFPHWFCGNFKNYDGKENELPVDQHELVALIAPRPVYVASAAEDGWADPRGELLAAARATPVYKLLGLEGLGDREPPLNQSIGTTIGYHVRAGKHALTDFDWLQYLDFADHHLKSR